MFAKPCEESSDVSASFSISLKFVPSRLRKNLIVVDFTPDWASVTSPERTTLTPLVDVPFIGARFVASGAVSSTFTVAVRDSPPSLASLYVAVMTLPSPAAITCGVEELLDVPANVKVLVNTPVLRPVSESVTLNPVWSDVLFKATVAVLASEPKYTRAKSPVPLVLAMVTVLMPMSTTDSPARLSAGSPTTITSLVESPLDSLAEFKAATSAAPAAASTNAFVIVPVKSPPIALIAAVMSVSSVTGVLSVASSVIPAQSAIGAADGNTVIGDAVLAPKL